MISKQIGKIRFSVNNYREEADIIALQSFFKDFFPLHIAPMYLTAESGNNSHVDFIGFHKDFAEVEEGGEIPEYVAIFHHQITDDKTIITCVKEIITRREYDRRNSEGLDKEGTL